MIPGPILILEDSEDDAMLLKLALKKNAINQPIQIVQDGLEGIAYLTGEGVYADRLKYPFPCVLIVDIKMPRMSGLEFLEWLKNHPAFKVIPTLILSSSKQERDIANAYSHGANSYMVKPSCFNDFERLVKTIHEYWKSCVVPIDDNIAASPKTQIQRGDAAPRKA